MSDEENQETRESPALTPEQAGGEAAPAADSAPDEVGFSLREDPGADHASGESPASAQARAESGDESPLDRPEVQILGAFLGAFVVAKILQKLLSRN